jgi:hypothetical protein
VEVDKAVQVLKTRFRRERKKLVDTKRSGSCLKKLLVKDVPLAKYLSVTANRMDDGIAARYFVSVHDILEPIICSNISKSEGVVLTKFLNPARFSSSKSAKRFSPYRVPSLRKCLVRHGLRFRWGVSFKRNTGEHEPQLYICCTT